jgi:hypothetical protein
MHGHFPVLAKIGQQEQPALHQSGVQTVGQPKWLSNL